MDRRIRRLTIALAGLFVLLFAQISYVQVFHADAIAGNAANAYRQIIAEYKVFRGPILANDARTRVGGQQEDEGAARVPAAVPGRRRCTRAPPATTRWCTAGPSSSRR